MIKSSTKRKKGIKGALRIDLNGLAAIQNRRGGKGHLVLELIQNALDPEDVTEVQVRLTREARSRSVKIEVEDDSPTGFKALEHAHTVFAKSSKAYDPGRRGMFNLGEKIVLACCRGGASISTTTGTIEFDIMNDVRYESKRSRARGSMFTGLIPMTVDEQAEAEQVAQSILPPKSITLNINGVKIPYREPHATLEIKGLPCILWSDDEHGNSGLRRSKRNTWIEVHQVKEGEQATLFVLGMPVVALSQGDKYHLNIGHRIPCDLERNSVPAKVLRQIRTCVLNNLHDQLLAEDVKETWVIDSLEKVDPDVIATCIKKRYGEKVASPPRPGDTESRKRWLAQEGVIVPGSAFTKKVWEIIREHKLLTTTSILSPSHTVVLKKRYGGGEPQKNLTAGMKEVSLYVSALGKKLLGHNVYTQFLPELPGNYTACYGNGSLTFNLKVLKRRWFDQGVRGKSLNKLLIHEFAHDQVSDHLSDAFHDECCRLGAALLDLSLEEPEFWGSTAPWRE